MANINALPNIHLQPNLPAYQRVQKNSWGIGSFVSSMVKRPVEYARWFWSPAPAPTETLRRIDQAAYRGIEKAKIRGVDVPQVSPKLHGEIDQLLEVRHDAERARALNAAEVGEVADLGRLLPDDEVTRAPLLQDRVEARDWKAEIIDRKDALSKKVTVFTTLLQMRDRCGIVEKNNLALMDLVKRATEVGNTPKSVWELFTSQYELTLFQKFKAAWFYVLFYLTSIIGNTVEAYLGRFIEKMTEDLARENSETRTLVFRTLIQNTNEFLIEDIRATKDFAYERDHGDLKDFHNRAIERVYGFSLSKLCEAFSEHRVDTDSPVVPVLRGFQDIPVIGSIFAGLERLVNHFIIQRTMKNTILPKALEEVVNKGLEATQPHNLPFTLSMTRFLTKRLEQLRTKIEKGLDTKPSRRFPGTEMLSPTIKNLKLALALGGASTPLELRRRFEEIEKDKKWGLEPKISQALEEAIVEAGNSLFGYLHETAESGELFANLLELAEEPFSGEEKDQELLLAEYKEEQSKLERTAKSVFQQLVHKAVSNKIYGSNKEGSAEIAHDSFEAQKVIANKTMDQLNEICNRMAQKIEASREAPSIENNVQVDIASFLQTLQVLASRKELQEELDNLDGVDRNIIWRTLNPLLEKAAQIQERVLRLQELQDHYPSHAAVVTHLNQMKDLLKSIRDQFHTQPRHLQNPLIQSLGKTADEITKCLGAKAPLHVKLQGFISQISDLSERIVREQQTIDAVHALYPPRYNAEDNEQEGLLDQLLNYERGIHPRGFRPQACLDEIRKYLAHLPTEERLELERIIGNGSNLRLKWPQLGEALQRIYTKHMYLKNNDKNLMDAALDAASAWVQEKMVKYTIVKEEDHHKMQDEMNQIVHEVTALQADARDIQLNIPASLSPRARQALCYLAPVAGAAVGAVVPMVAAAVSTTAGTAAAWVGGTATASIGSALGGAFGKWWRGEQGTKENSARSIAKKMGGVALGYFGASWLPASWTAAGVSAAQAGIAATTGYAGWSTMTAGQSIAEDEVYRQVWDIFTNAHQLMISDRVYKAAVTRTMQAMIESQ